MDIETSLQKLYSLHSFGVKLGLENISAFLNYIGDPQKHLKAFHVAGSNGKGSTSAFISSILRECGFKTGLYTSPHFVKFNERIMVNNDQISDEAIVSFYEQHEKFISDFKLTFFEVTTAMAFQYFKEQKVDYAVIETGLGGRLDATNVLNPCAVIITSVSLEHTQILGETIEKIAGEKAGIIKNNSKVFIGNLPAEAVGITERKCAETNSRLFKIEDYTNEKPGILELYTEELELDDWTMPLKGDYQKYNAALASLAVSKTLNIDDFGKIETGIKNVIANTGFQGRYEFFSNKPDIILDSAHNTESVNNFLSEFKKSSMNYSKRSLLFGVLNDKNAKEMLSQLNNYFDNIYITEVAIDRTLKINELKEIAEEVDVKVIPAGDPVKFVSGFRYTAGREECLVILGSMYLLGEIKSSPVKNKIA